MERKLIAVAVSSALGLPLAAHAVEGSVSGHVNRAIISVDDGGTNDGDWQHVDSNASESRVRFVGSEELDSGMTVGVNLELGLGGEKYVYKDENDGVEAKEALRFRHQNVYLSGGFGKLTIGQGSAATDGMAHADLGGPSWLGGATNWCSYHSSGPACPSNDGGRPETLRYDTPALGPASIAVSFDNNDYWDVKVTVAGSMGGGYGYDLRVGYIDETTASAAGHGGAPDDLVGRALTVSGAISFGQGTSAAAAWSDADADGYDADHSYVYTKLDHSYGDGSVGIYYKTGEYDVMNTKTDGSLWGVGIGHNVGGGATAYAGYRQIAQDRQKDIDLLLAGMRVTFN